MPGHGLTFTRTYTRRFRFRKCKWACAFLADWLRLLYFSHTRSVNQKALPCKVAQNTVSANHMLRVHAHRSRSMSARAHPARHLSIAKTQTRALNKCAKGGRSVPSGAQTSWLIHTYIKAKMVQNIKMRLLDQTPKERERLKLPWPLFWVSACRGSNALAVFLRLVLLKWLNWKLTQWHYCTESRVKYNKKLSGGTKEALARTSASRTPIEIHSATTNRTVSQWRQRTHMMWQSLHRNESGT